MPQPPDGDAPPTFEQSLSELQQIVHDLEEGNLGLEASLARFEEGIRRLRSCYRILEEAEQKIEILTGVDAEGNPVTEPFDASATFEGGEKPAKKPGRRRGAAKGETLSREPPASSESRDRESGGLF